VPLSGPIIQQKAKLFAAKLGIEQFEASNGWLTNVDTAVAEDWIENVLPGLIEGYELYEPRDIFNTDETGLFFKCLPGF
jgi:Tc5 transposase DNA-binding domain